MAQPQGSNEYVYIEIWYPAGENFYVGLLSPNGDSCGHWGPHTGNAPPGLFSPRPWGGIGIHNEDYDLGHPDSFPYTQGEIVIQLADYYVGYPLDSGIWTITMDSGIGRWDAYITLANTIDSTYIIDYSNEGTIEEPGNAECVITVGSYNSKNSWLSADGNTYIANNFPLGDSSYFSSRGPTRDGRNKPNILAPGAIIASSVSDSYISGPIFLTGYDSRMLAYDSCHYHQAGTSFSAPHITGLIALMLQVDPELMCIDILDCLENTAWPDGKVNPIEALRCVGADSFCQGRCGNANGDATVNVSDAVYIINYVFIGGASPMPILACGDANGDGGVNVADAEYIINFVYIGGLPPGDCSPGSWVGRGGDCCPY